MKYLDIFDSAKAPIADGETIFREYARYKKIFRYGLEYCFVSCYSCILWTVI